MAPGRKTKDKSSSSSQIDSSANEQLDLYRVLLVEKSANSDVIRKAYYKLALLHHPDRNSSPESKKIFQNVGLAYEILSDQKKRTLYDETGIIEGQADIEGGGNWATYFRELFQKVTFADLDAFKATYTGSVEEYEDVLAAYVKHRGDLPKITDSVFFGDVDNEPRYSAMIKRAISKDIIPSFDSFQKIFSDESVYQVEQRKRKRRAEKEAYEAAEMAKELGFSGGRDNLIAAINQRQKGRFDALIAQLESKYSTNKKATPPSKK